MKTDQPRGTQAIGVLALELAPGTAPGTAALAQARAGHLATLLARDLAALVPEAAGLDFCLAAAHFDPAEALRPGWPLHRRLSELHARAPRGGGGPRIIAFGADARGQLPRPLQCDPALHGGPLRVLPWALIGEADLVATVADAFEAVLLDRGMVQADTALLAQEAFAARIEHARAMTVHDLAAMTALQYEHTGLGPLWPVIETALLTPGAEAALDSPPEPEVRYAAGRARIPAPPMDAWRERCARDEQDEERLGHGWAMFNMRRRQFAAVLSAHGIEVELE